MRHFARYKTKAAWQRQASRPRTRRGFALLMTVVLILIVVLLLTGIARRSLLVAMEASALQDEMQRRWGALSCRDVVLARADSLFAWQTQRLLDSGKVVVPLPNKIEAAVTLGEMEFDLALADEQAKLNLNRARQALVERSRSANDEPRVDATVRRLVGGDSLLTLAHERPVLPRIGVEGASRLAVRNGTLSIAPWESWGEVFELSAVTDASSLPSKVQQATGALTLWGNGPTNVWRAPDDVLAEICRLTTSRNVARRLQQARQEVAEAAQELLQAARTTSRNPTNQNSANSPVDSSPIVKWESAKLLDSLALPHEERLQLGQWLTDESHCHSLWISTRHGTRTWHQLHLREAERPGQVRGVGFAW